MGIETTLYFHFILNLIHKNHTIVHISGILCDIMIHIYVVYLNQIKYSYLYKHLFFLYSENKKNVFPLFLFWVCMCVLAIYVYMFMCMWGMHVCMCLTGLQVNIWIRMSSSIVSHFIFLRQILFLNLKPTIVASFVVQQALGIHMSLFLLY